MKRILYAGVALLAAAVQPAQAADTVKVGMIISLSGQFADTGMQMLNGAKLYVKQHGDTVTGKKIEIIAKDVGGINPPVAKRLAQELVTRDNVDVLAGFDLTPNALAAADVSLEAKRFMVNMNAATAIVIEKSPYMVRTSMTVPQLNTTLGTWAEKNAGVKKAYHGRRFRAGPRCRRCILERFQSLWRRRSRIGTHGRCQ